MTITKHDIEAAIALTDQATKAARELERQAAELRQRLGLARGTRRDLKPVNSARPTVEDVLRRRVASPVELSAETGLPVAVVEAELAAAKKRGRVVDLGRGWSWVIGDEGPTAELNDLVVRLLTTRPMTFAELIAATGAREKRVSGAIVRIQRDPALAKKLVRSGTQTRAEWRLRR